MFRFVRHNGFFPERYLTRNHGVRVFTSERRLVTDPDMLRGGEPYMMNVLRTLALALIVAGVACAGRVDIEKVPIGTDVEVTRQDGGVVRGTLAARDDTTVKVTADSGNRSIPRAQITSVRLMPAPGIFGPAAPTSRAFTLPAGTRLAVRVESAVGSDSSQAGDPVEATLTDDVTVDGTSLFPAGSVVTGQVSEAQPGGNVKGRASLVLLFESVSVPGRDGQVPILARVGLVAPSGRDKDVATIAIPAAGGAIIGALVGGGKGALIGTAIGGGAGTAVAMSTRGPQIRLGRGAVLSLQLVQSADVRVPIHGQ